MNMILHDAVRYNMSQRILSDICEALLKYVVIDVTVSCTDTIVEEARDLPFWILQDIIVVRFLRLFV